MSHGSLGCRGCSLVEKKYWSDIKKDKQKFDVSVESVLYDLTCFSSVYKKIIFIYREILGNRIYNKLAVIKMEMPNMNGSSFAML